MSAAEGKPTECSVFSSAARNQTRKERRAGLILIAAGAFAVIESAPYGFGTLRQIGPGFFPTILGIALVALGCAIMLTARSQKPEEDIEGAHAKRREPSDLRGWIAVVSAVALFMALTPRLGLAPGTFACVLAAALGDRGMTIVSAAALAAIVSIAGALVFVLGLGIPLPYFAF